MAFSPRFSMGLEGFLHRLSHWFSSLFSHWVRGFFTYVQIISPTTYTFGGAHTKKEDNCSAEVTRLMVMWPINLIYFMLKSYIPQPHLFSHLVQFCHHYNPSFILVSTRIQSSQIISASSFETRSAICLNKLLQIKQNCLNTSLKDYLQVNAFLDLVVIEQEE